MISVYAPPSDYVPVMEQRSGRLLDDLHITQPTLSHHMKILCDAGIVQGPKEGKWVHYSINPKGPAHAGYLSTLRFGPR